MASNITVSNIGDNILDSRDLAELLEELKNERDDLAEAESDALEELEEAREETEGDSIVEAEEAHDAALDALREFEDEHAHIIRDLEDAESEIGDWHHGETLIHERYWTEYVQEMMEELGYINKDAWFIEIDWEATAKNIAMDYTEVEIDGYTYYVRA